MTEPTTPRRTAPVEENGRRLLPAGYAVVIMVVALAVGTLLNAQGLREDGAHPAAGLAARRRDRAHDPARRGQPRAADRPAQAGAEERTRAERRRPDRHAASSSRAGAGGAAAVPPSRDSFSPARQLRSGRPATRSRSPPGKSVYRPGRHGRGEAGGAGRRASRDRPRAAGRLQLVHVHPRRARPARAAGGRGQLRRQRRPRLHDRNPARGHDRPVRLQHVDRRVPATGGRADGRDHRSRAGSSSGSAPRSSATRPRAAASSS